MTAMVMNPMIIPVIIIVLQADIIVTAVIITVIADTIIITGKIFFSAGRFVVRRNHNNILQTTNVYAISAIFRTISFTFSG